MNSEHSKYCHCVCQDLFEYQAAIEQARAIHIQYTPNDKPCLVCNTTNGSCNNCRWLKDCVACGQKWPCDTYIALDFERS